MTSSTETLSANFQKGGGPISLPDREMIELGKIVSNAEALEIHIIRLLAELVRCDLATAIICFSSPSAAAKRALVLNLADQRFSDKSHKKMRILDPMVRYERVTGHRNRIVHATWKIEDGVWKRAYFQLSVQQWDTIIGGHPDRLQKTNSLREKYDYSVSDMGDVLDEFASLSVEVQALIEMDLRATS